MSIEDFNRFQREEGLPELPTVWHICDHCHGEGTLGGWAGAYTESDRAEWSEEDYEDYRTTRRTCDECNGSGKVRGISLDSPDEIRHAFYEWERDEYETNAIYRMEQRMGA